MATQTVYIGITSPATYSPAPPVVKPSDSVVFILQGRTDSVTVTFDSGSPFSQTSFNLDGASALTAQKTESVVAGASGKYHFTAKPPGVGTRTISEDPEQPGTVSGDLEVTPDSHHPETLKRSLVP